MNTPTVMELTGATERQLGYWIRLGLIRPEQPGDGPGYYRTWTPTDALQAWAIYELSLACTGSARGLARATVDAIRVRESGDTVCVAWNGGAVCATAEAVPDLVREHGPLRVLVFPAWAMSEAVAA